MTDDLRTKSNAELIAAWLDNLRTYELIEHVGAAKRHFGNGVKIADEMKARCDGQPSLFVPLLQHHDLEVR